MLFYTIESGKNLSKKLKHIRCISNTVLLRTVKVPDEAIPKNLLEKYYDYKNSPKGTIYDKRPFRLTLEANKKYAWCSCGYSKTQPLCDGTHKIPTLKIKLKPFLFMVEETKEYWLCNCKQSSSRPFCDGTHTSEEVQSSLRHFKN